MLNLSGIWIPLVTPFLDGELDLAGYERLVDHYIEQGVAGLVVLGTTGESPTVDQWETEQLVACAVRVAGGRVPILVGVGGNDTRQVMTAVRGIERQAVQGILSVCPYYSRPGQDGLREHFTRVAGATSLPVVIYNIPYRTGVNLSNDTLLTLAGLPNVAGVKDSSGNLTQSLALLRDRPEGFAVLTGEDALLFTTLANGGDGAILASAHLQTRRFVEVFDRIVVNDHQGARQVWRRLDRLVTALFAEPNPMPLKHCLQRQGLIRSAECRLPLTRISRELEQVLEHVLAAA